MVAPFLVFRQKLVEPSLDCMTIADCFLKNGAGMFQDVVKASIDPIRIVLSWLRDALVGEHVEVCAADSIRDDAPSEYSRT